MCLFCQLYDLNMNYMDSNVSGRSKKNIYIYTHFNTNLSANYNLMNNFVFHSLIVVYYNNFIIYQV